MKLIFAPKLPYPPSRLTGARCSVIQLSKLTQFSLSDISIYHITATYDVKFQMDCWLQRNVQTDLNIDLLSEESMFNARAEVSQNIPSAVVNRVQTKCLSSHRLNLFTQNAAEVQIASFIFSFSY